jgi:hypothetical protein
MAEGLAEPPVPAHLAAMMQPRGPHVLATRPLPKSLYSLDHFLHEIEASPDTADYAAVGFAGHGVNSWAAHCYVVSGPLALFVQLPWGGAFIDVESARDEIADVFAWGAALQSRVQAVKDLHRIPAGWRLEVSASRLGRAGWRWLTVGRDNAPVPWKGPAGMKSEVPRILEDALAGRIALQ